MDPFAFIQNSLKNPWVVLGLSGFILLLGWVFSRLFAKWTVSLLNRTRIINFIVKRFNLTDAESINPFIRQLTRMLIILMFVWISWQTLNSHPDISIFLTQAWKAISSFVKLPVVVFILNLLLVGLATYLLFKAFGWVKTGFSVIDRRIKAEKEKRLKGFKIRARRTIHSESIDRFSADNQQVCPLWGQHPIGLDPPGGRF